MCMIMIINFCEFRYQSARSCPASIILLYCTIIYHAGLINISMLIVDKP